MIIGVGTDILAVDRMRDIESDHAFLSRVYSQAERKEAQGRNNALMYYCTRFAGKEAVFKSLCISPESVRLNDIEILTGEHGKPYVNLLGNMKSIALSRGVSDIQISLSWEKDYAVAFAVACSKI